MSETYVFRVLDELNSTSSVTIQEALIKIRSKITTSDAGIRLFRECNGFECLLSNLRKPNERILDISLSIIGNCCLDEECRLLMVKLDIIPAIIRILKTVCKDSIIGRACRVLGNLAKVPSIAEAFHCHGAGTALVTVIENRDKNTSYPTLSMAVRAIRHLWMVQDRRDDLLRVNAVRCIVTLLTTECETKGILNPSIPKNKQPEAIKKSQEELIADIIKCLGFFTTYSTAQCADQIQGDGRGYQCLVALAKNFQLNSLKCLLNLCYVSTCRPLLGTAGFVEFIVCYLQKIPDVARWPEGGARAIAHLSGEAVNRSRLRHCGGLPLLVAAARTHSCAMHALIQYVFDDTSFQILINEGLINLLTDQLNKYLSTMSVDHDDTTPSCDNSYDITDEDTSNTTPGSVSSQARDARIRGLASCNEEDELKVVIERDNMIVGFVDAIDSDASDDSQSAISNIEQQRKNLKRTRSGSPINIKKKSQLIKMASTDWSAGVYWEPKSPEWSSISRPLGPRVNMSPDREEPGPSSPYADGNRSGFSPEYRGLVGKRAKCYMSPDSGEGSSASPYWTDNGYPWSPSSSESRASPFSVNECSSDSEISGRYSPVCSDDGDAIDLATTDVTAELDAAQVAHNFDELIMEDDVTVEDEIPLEDEANRLDLASKSSGIACVLVLLYRVSHGACRSFGALCEEPVSNHTLELLTGSTCLNALLDYVERSKKPLGRAARILARVLSNALCLMNILKNNIVLRLHRMSVSSRHLPAKCQQCKQIMRLSSKLLTHLTILAESSYGIGEISYQLIKGTPSMKSTLAIALPYIVKNEKPLKKYFIDYGALNMIFKIVATQYDVRDAVVALEKIATNIKLKDPKQLENKFQDHVFVNYDPILDNLSEDDIVTFLLDDSSTVQANKIFLCKNSDVFSAMLMGCFKESIDDNVVIKNVSKPALEHLFTLLHFGLNNPKCNVKIFPMSNKLAINLEVLLLADRFLFEKLKTSLSSAIQQFQMTPRTVGKIYKWSLTEGMGFLCVESVAYLLTGKMSEAERTQILRNILDGKYKDQCIEDIKSMIHRQLLWLK